MFQMVARQVIGHYPLTGQKDQQAGVVTVTGSLQNTQSWIHTNPPGGGFLETVLPMSNSQA